MTSNADDIEITFKGRGDHGASPEKTIDPVLDRRPLYRRCSKHRQPREGSSHPGVVTIGSILGGTVGNIIPDQCRQRDDPRLRCGHSGDLAVGVERTARAEAAMAGAPEPDIKIGRQKADAVVNDRVLTERTAAVFKAAFGAGAVEDPRPITASEDYSAFISGGCSVTLLHDRRL